MKLPKTLNVLITIVAVSVITGEVIAAKPTVMPKPPDYDVKSYPGSGCRQIAPSELAFGWNCNTGSIGDPSITVTCPIVRDDVMGEDGTYDLQVDVYQGAGGLAGCVAVSWDRNNVIESVSDSNTDYGETTLFVDLNESVPGGYYTLECSLAPQACIRSYRVYEAQGDYSKMTDYER
jgi:hypothetical protein